MARATYGAIITDLKGSIGGTTFQHNGSGKIVRQRPRIISQYSLKQNSVNSTFYKLVRAWHLINIDSQLLWNTFAGLHTKDNYYAETKTLNGFQWFLSINAYRLLCSETMLANPPSWTVPAAVPSYSLSITSAGVFITFDSAYTLTNDVLFIYTSPPVLGVTTKLRNKYRYTKLVTAGTYNTIDITSDWEAAHGLTFLDVINGCSIRIASMLFNCRLSTGLVSTTKFDIYEFINAFAGIGDMVIESSFIVSSD